MPATLKTRPPDPMANASYKNSTLESRLPNTLSAQPFRSVAPPLPPSR